MIHQVIPTHFENALNVAGCMVYNEKGEILLLKRVPNKSWGETWGDPGGKIDKNETPREAIKRELFEETGIIVSKEDFEEIETLYVTIDTDGKNIIYYLFSIKYNNSPIQLNPNEHSEYKWYNQENSLKIPLIHDMKPCIETFYKKYSF